MVTKKQIRSEYNRIKKVKEQVQESMEKKHPGVFRFGGGEVEVVSGTDTLKHKLTPRQLTLLQAFYYYKGAMGYLQILETKFDKEQLLGGG